jgi:hypothetical protein
MSRMHSSGNNPDQEPPQKGGLPVSPGTALEMLPSFTRWKGSTDPNTAPGLTASGYKSLGVQNYSVEGYFLDDHFVGKWDAKFNTPRYFDEIQSTGPRGRMEPFVRTLAIVNEKSTGAPVDAFDQLGIVKSVQSGDPLTTNAYVMFFGKEPLPSIMMALSTQSRHIVEAAHVEAISTFLVSLRENSIEASAVASRAATKAFLKSQNVLYVHGFD